MPEAGEIGRSDLDDEVDIVLNLEIAGKIESHAGSGSGPVLTDDQLSVLSHYDQMSASLGRRKLAPAVDAFLSKTAEARAELGVAVHEIAERDVEWHNVLQVASEGDFSDAEALGLTLLMLGLRVRVDDLRDHQAALRSEAVGDFVRRATGTEVRTTPDAVSTRPDVHEARMSLSDAVGSIGRSVAVAAQMRQPKQFSASQQSVELKFRLIRNGLGNYGGHGDDTG